jgi:hypothetical protein
MNSMTKKPMTIDDLAVMVQKGFDHVDDQFTHVHHELKAIRKELLGVVYRPEFDDLQERVRELEGLLSGFKKKAA